MNMVNFIEDFVIAPEGSYDLNSEIGSGYYANVFDSNMPGMVVKKIQAIGYFNDAWIFWAIYCMTAKRKYSWMPNIYGMVIDRRKKQVHAIMEKLEEKNGNIFKEYATGFFHKKENFKITRPKLKETVLKVLNDIEAIIYDSKIKPDCNVNFPFYFDAHINNWMWRKNEKRSTLVLTDPLIITCDFESNKRNIKLYNDLICEMAHSCSKIKII